MSDPPPRPAHSPDANPSFYHHVQPKCPATTTTQASITPKLLPSHPTTLLPSHTTTLLLPQSFKVLPPHQPMVLSLHSFKFLPPCTFTQPPNAAFNKISCLCTHSISSHTAPIQAPTRLDEHTKLLTPHPARTLPGRKVRENLCSELST